MTTQSGGSLEALLTKVQEGERTVFRMAEEVEGQEGKRLVVERVALPPEPPKQGVRRESPPRHHRFYARAGFMDYLQEHGGEHVVLYADPRRRRVDAVLDERADTGFEVVSLEPMEHPAWAPWAAKVGKVMPLLEFVDLIRDNRRAIVEPDGAALVLMLSQVRAQSEVELQVGSGRRAINGLMVTTTITGQPGGRGQQEVELPDSIRLRLPLYVEADEEEVELDLILDAKGDQITARFSSADIRAAQIAAFQELVGVIRAQVETAWKGAGDAVFTYGSPDWGAWSYLPEVRS